MESKNYRTFAPSPLWASQFQPDGFSLGRGSEMIGSRFFSSPLLVCRSCVGFLQQPPKDNIGISTLSGDYRCACGKAVPTLGCA